MSDPALTHSKNVPIQQQPVTTWMTSNPIRPPNQSDPLKNLHMLSHTTGLFVQQKVRWGSLNKFKIFDHSGTHVLTARQNFDCCTGNNFSMTIDDLRDQPVFEVMEPVTCFSSDHMDVFLPGGGRCIGRIDKEFTFMTPKFNLYDGQGNLQFKIKGPVLTTSWLGDDVHFKILMPNYSNGRGPEGVAVGQISKQWAGTAREFFTEADNFGVKFPPTATLGMKAVILSACLFIDWKYYDSQSR